MYKRQALREVEGPGVVGETPVLQPGEEFSYSSACDLRSGCLLYTSDAADERSSVDLGGRRIIKKK